MSSCVVELDGILQSMLELKAPGVSRPKVESITALCNANVQSETVLIQKVYTHFKKAPGTHKLGVLYVVDSVARQWLEQAIKTGQTLGPSAPDGTYAAGVNHIAELLPSFMTDIINTAPEEHKATKIKKLIDIWERGNTFPAPMLSSFKEKLNASTTPDGSPPQETLFLNPQPAKAAPPTQDTAAILANLQALANMAKQNPTGPTVPVNTAQGNLGNVTFPQNTFSNMSSVNANPSVPSPAHVNVPGAQNLNGVYSYAGMTPAPQNFIPNPSNGLSNVQAVPANMLLPGNSGLSPEKVQQQLQLLQLLQAQNIPQEQWAPLLSVLMAQNAGGTAAAPTPAAYGTINGGRDDPSRDRNGYDQHYRSPPRGYGRNRSRSRSPAWRDRGRDSPARRRDSPVYGEYGNDRNGRRGDDGRRGGGRGRGNNRRSPDRFRRSPSPNSRRGAEQPLPAPGPKWVDRDPSIGKGNIKVLSRTLFVGGVTSSEEDLRKIFLAFGRVQTCIVNVDKRHAFVKMITRGEAQQAKDGMEHYKSPEMQLRTRWGVGFGPRDCSDYQTGISIIPIERLTDADRKWMTTAEFGGTGGKPIEEFQVVEEPDIEIGAGVSSKAISRRMQTDKGGQQGPRSTRDPPTASRFRQPEPKEEPAPANPPMMAQPLTGFNFPFSFGSNGVPIFPPGFVMPGQTPAQPPPPGAT